MSYPTIFIGGESQFALPPSLGDFTDDVVRAWLDEAVDAAAVVLQDVNYVPIPDEKLETFWYVNPATEKFTVAWRLLCRPASLPH